MATAKASAHKCVLCQKNKPGRFTRRKDKAGGGWSKGLQLPAWYCYPCLPAGQGRDETEETVAHVKAPAGVSFALAPAESMKKSEVLAILPTLQQEVHELTEEMGYEYADSLLGRVRDVRKAWAPVWTRIMEKTVTPIRSGLENLYEMNREVEKPINAMEQSIKSVMKSIKEDEARRLAAAEMLRRQELMRIAQQEEEAARKEQAAMTNQMRGRLAAVKNKLTEMREAVEAQPRPEPVQGVSSGTRTIPSWRLQYDDEQGSHLHQFLTGILEGVIPSDAILLNDKFITAQFKNSPETVASWPGIEVYDDIQIVGR